MNRASMQLRILGLVCMICLGFGCKQGGGCAGKGLPGTKYILRCTSSAVHCKGTERRFQTTKCFPNGQMKLVDQALKSAQKSAYQAYTSGGDCTKQATFKCFIHSEAYGDCKPSQ